MWRFLYNRSGDDTAYEQSPEYEKLLEEIQRLAASYLPEWRFRTDDADIGSVIALIFAGQMEDVIKQSQKLPYRGLKELVDMLGIRPPKPAPARTVLVFETDAGAREGIRITEGSRFLCADISDAPLVSFQTEQDLLAMPAGLSAVLQISSKKKKVTSCLPGNVQISMFECLGQNIYNEWLEVRHRLLKDGGICLFKEDKETSFTIRKAAVRAFGKRLSPLFLYDGNREIQTEAAAIFGEEISPYKECFIGQDEVFSKAGAEVSLSFELEWRVCHTGRHEETEKELKPVMKRRPKEEKEPAMHVYPQEISISYYNGNGFKQLCTQEKTAMLTKVSSRKQRCSIRFSCPDDWQPLHAGAYHMRCVRLRVEKAAHSYRPGVISHYPVLSRISFSYSYGRDGVKPEGIIRHRGVRQEDLTEQVFRGEEPEVFPGFPYEGESVLLGFDRVLSGGPTGIYLMLENQTGNADLKAAFEYSTGKGFRPLHAADATRGLIQSGIVRFTLPPDAAMTDIEGHHCFWIRLTKQGEDDCLRQPPQLLGIKMNAVGAVNLYHSDEREYTLEQPVPNLTAELSGTCIVSASVWVNECGSLTDEKKAWMLENCPGEVRAAYDIRGRETEFLVKWKEAESLEQIPPGGRYYLLDRNEKKLCFGDGRHGRIPQETAGTAFRVRTLLCDGRRGNVPGERITEPVRAYPLLKRVSNPSGAYGGSDGGTGEELMKRGRTELSTGARVVSEADLLCETENFSVQIRQASFYKDRDGQLNLIVLVDENERGCFAGLREELEKHLNTKFPLSRAAGRLIIREPVFVKVSVNVWIHADGEVFFQEKDRLLRALETYFSHGERGGRKWGIGRLPEKKEVERALYQASGSARIRYIQVTLSYRDAGFIHETDLEEMKPIPDAVCTGGTYGIFTEKRSPSMNIQTNTEE